MNYFRVVGDGAIAAQPLEEVVETAASAISAKYRLKRLCGRAGKVTIFGKDGRLIGDSKLARLAREEQFKAMIATSIVATTEHIQCRDLCQTNPLTDNSDSC